MFPGAHARVYTNEAGEPIGWDYPSDAELDAYDRDMDEDGIFADEGEEDDGD